MKTYILGKRVLIPFRKPYPRLKFNQFKKKECFKKNGFHSFLERWFRKWNSWFFFHLLKLKKKKKSPILTYFKKDFENDNDWWFKRCPIGRLFLFKDKLKRNNHFYSFERSILRKGMAFGAIFIIFKTHLIKLLIVWWFRVHGASWRASTFEPLHPWEGNKENKKA